MVIRVRHLKAEYFLLLVLAEFRFDLFFEGLFLHGFNEFIFFFCPVAADFLFWWLVASLNDMCFEDFCHRWLAVIILLIEIRNDFVNEIEDFAFGKRAVATFRLSLMI